MLYMEIIAVCSEIHTKHINTLCGQKVEVLNVKPGGTYSEDCSSKGEHYNLLAVILMFCYALIKLSQEM